MSNTLWFDNPLHIHPAILTDMCSNERQLILISLFTGGRFYILKRYPKIFSYKANFPFYSVKCIYSMTKLLQSSIPSRNFSMNLITKNSKNVCCASKSKSWHTFKSIWGTHVASETWKLKMNYHQRVTTGQTDARNIEAAFQGMHVSPAKHIYAWQPRKCDYRTDRQTDTEQSDPYVPLCFAGDTISDPYCKTIWSCPTSSVILYYSHV